jgi:hypothetical protein
MEESVNVIDEIPQPHRDTLVAVLAERDPRLLAALRHSTLPTEEQWDTVSETLNYALADHWGPDHVPDETGVRIDNALGAFMTRWPNDQLAGS